MARDAKIKKTVKHQLMTISKKKCVTFNDITVWKTTHSKLKGVGRVPQDAKSIEETQRGFNNNDLNR